MRKLRIVLVFLSLAAVVASGGYAYFIYAPKPVQPKLSSVEKHANIQES
jgi:hypothetical protein